MKGYVVAFREWLHPDGCKVMGVSFDSKPERAGSYASRYDAELDCRILDSWRLVTDSAEGGKHICSGFQAEQVKGGRFVIYCDAPFISAKPIAQSANHKNTSL